MLYMYPQLMSIQLSMADVEVACTYVSSLHSIILQTCQVKIDHDVSIQHWPHVLRPLFLAQDTMQYKMASHGARVDLACIIC